MAGSTTVRVDHRTHEALRRISLNMGEPIARIVARAIFEYEEKIFWEESRRAMARLKADPVAYAEYKRESEMWELASLEDFEKSVPPYFDADHPR